ncbi:MULTISPECIES: potassium transporter Kup [Sphingobium]|uniref:Probable potassium transport system protein Kup n=1 Tax=Sphingobium indicum F2 TaxID=1450518 RepID=A0A8E1C3J0_9SPHN|nr:MULTISPECIES: potassium transporter Kup [Sphingobium]KER37329.1 potassium transport protein Kup [Sphingobium indicum F2]
MTDRAGEGVGHSHPQEKLSLLTLGALGVVFGDIGTSPLYALKESFVGHHPLAVDSAHIYGVLSLVFWTMTLIVTVKYVFIIMRADNHGEGGSMALLALISRKLGESRWTPTIAILGVLAAALFYGDAIITPAVSVLSAVEGLETVNDGLTPFVLPIAIVILTGLFLIQKHGTARVGALFGPIMAVYFLVLAALGILNIARHPGIVAIVNPMWAIHFFALDAKLAFLALGSVVLAVTGAEALYADMGHFGRKAISIAWLYAAFPCLLLNYMGQGALLLDLPAAAENPFFLLAPEWARLPLVILATIATVIASQAVISGAFSVTQQAVQLGFLPRLKIAHTSAAAAGQIYVPLVNWALLFLVVLLVLGFQSSSNLAAAYGIAVTGTMVITTCMMAVLTFSVWRWNRLLAAGVTGLFLTVDGAYFLSNATKIPDGGWFPLWVAAVVFVILTTWSTGRKIMNFYLLEGAMDVELFIQSVSGSLKRVPGTAIFLNSRVEGVPPALLHNVKHNKILHERVIILTVRTEGVPHLPLTGRSEVTDLGSGFYRVVLRHGFMEEVDIPAAMKAVEGCGGPINVSQTSYFLSRQTLIPSEKPGMAIWREKLFAWMMRNAVTPMDFFKLPTNRVVELGSQVEI